MLARAENVSIHFVPHIFSKQGHVRLAVGKTTRFDYHQLRLTQPQFGPYVSGSYDKPMRFVADGKVYWLFQFKFYKDHDNLNSDEVKALLITRKRLQVQKINRAKTLAALEESAQTSRSVREKIPDDVKLIVWERDEGKCAKCGSNVELQYDHVIPFSLGGASTPENLQILCGTCNRAKSASIV